MITGEPIDARNPYERPINFRPIAQHVFACNKLPRFEGGMDRGVRRRLLVIPFNRTIPPGERIEHIGTRVCQEEADLLLAWAVAGAERLLRQRRFTEPESSAEALRAWLLGTDPVLGWIADRIAAGLAVVGEKPARLASSTAYADFNLWSDNEGYRENRRISKNTFVQRVTAAMRERDPSVKHVDAHGFRGWEGMRLKPKPTLAEMERALDG